MTTAVNLRLCGTDKTRGSTTYTNLTGIVQPQGKQTYFPIHPFVFINVLNEILLVTPCSHMHSCENW